MKKEKKELDPKKKKVLLIVSLVLCVLFIVGLVVLLINRSEEARKNEKYEPVIDEYSGDEIWNIDQEPEFEPSLNLIGFYRILNYGFMNSQYQKIIAAITDYMSENYSNIMQISFWTETFKIDDMEAGTYEFKFVAEMDLYIK